MNKISEIKPEIENFLFYENKLLDDGEYSLWLGLLSSKYQSYMPIKSNALVKRKENNNADPSRILSHYDEDYESIRVRLDRYIFSQKTKMVPSESPEPVFIRYISNIYISEITEELCVAVEYNFIIRRMRLEKDVDIFYGKKKDYIKHDSESKLWYLEKRHIDLASNVIQSNNLNLIF